MSYLTLPKLSSFLLALSLLLIPRDGVAGRGTIKVGSATNSNVIRVWTVGSPHTGALPEATVPGQLKHQAEQLGYTIEIKNFRAAGFAARFRQAMKERNEPEILTFDNYGVVLGIKTEMGWFEGLMSDYQVASSLAWVHESLVSLQPRGWVFLLRSAANHEAARALATSAIICEREVGGAGSPAQTPELRQARETALAAARAYMRCDRSSLSALSDKSRLGASCYFRHDNTQVEAIDVCGVSGNSNFAMVSLVSNFEAQSNVIAPFNQHWRPSMDLGHQSLLAILRKEGGQWRVLAITHDPTDTDKRTNLALRRLGSLLGDATAESVTPEPARLLTPDGVYPRPEPNQRFGDFLWRPSPNENVVCEIPEFWFPDDRMGPRLSFLFGREGKLSSGQIWGNGARWRVWSITRSGAISFSREHSFVRWPAK